MYALILIRVLSSKLFAEYLLGDIVNSTLLEAPLVYWALMFLIEFFILLRKKIDLMKNVYLQMACLMVYINLQVINVISSSRIHISLFNFTHYIIFLYYLVSFLIIYFFVKDNNYLETNLRFCYLCVFFVYLLLICTKITQHYTLLVLLFSNSVWRLTIFLNNFAYLSMWGFIGFTDVSLKDSYHGEFLHKIIRHIVFPIDVWVW